MEVILKQENYLDLRIVTEEDFILIAQMSGSDCEWICIDIDSDFGKHILKFFEEKKEIVHENYGGC